LREHLGLPLRAEGSPAGGPANGGGARSTALGVSAFSTISG